MEEYGNDDPTTTGVYIKLTSEEKALLNARSKLRGVSLTDYILSRAIACRTCGADLGENKSLCHKCAFDMTDDLNKPYAQRARDMCLCGHERHRHWEAVPCVDCGQGQCRGFRVKRTPAKVFKKTGP